MNFPHRLKRCDNGLSFLLGPVNEEPDVTLATFVGERTFRWPPLLVIDHDRKGDTPKGVPVVRFLVEEVEGFTGNHRLRELELAVGHGLGEVGVGGLAVLLVPVHRLLQAPNLAQEFGLLGVQRGTRHVECCGN